MSLFRFHLARSRSSPLSTQPKYATQGASHRRTEEAILQGTKDLIAIQGLSKISMIDISATSEVARATLYNHFRDKNSVVEALLTSEISRVIEQAQSAGTPADALEFLSIAISSDAALAGLRQHDPALIAQLLIHSEHPLYLDLARAIFALTQSQSATGLAMRWLLGQVVQPLTAEQSREQAALLVENTLF
jgi:TetR/AcrR family transcriptional regulator, transcriptional repressor of aconitase